MEADNEARRGGEDSSDEGGEASEGSVAEDSEYEEATGPTQQGDMFILSYLVF